MNKKRLRDGWLTRLFEPALYQVSVRSFAVLTGMWLTTILGQFTSTFAGFLRTLGHPFAVALV